MSRPCRLGGMPKEGEWYCACGTETEWESAEQHIVRVALSKVDTRLVTLEMSGAMPWYDDSQPNYDEAEDVLRKALGLPSLAESARG